LMSDATIHLLVMTSRLLDAPIELAVLTPPGFSADGESQPLCVVLHGGGGDRNVLVNDRLRYAAAWTSGEARPMVMVAPSTGPLSWYGDPWGEVIADEIPAFMSERFNTRTDREAMALTGRSMGGYGTLNIGLKRPDRFAAIASLEPAVEPGLTRGAASPRNNFYRFADVDARLWGDPIDDARWAADNPANIAIENMSAIRDSGLEIYLDAGDQDALNLHDGTEFLHRTLWDLDIRHEYHLVRWADHVGRSFDRRVPEAFGFLSDALAGGRSAPTELELDPDEQAWVDWVRGDMNGEPRTIDLTTERGPALLAIMNEAKKVPAMALDPTFDRAYGLLSQDRPSNT
jgi:S-formylglutathione hydrolase